jgi:hypothetical protein
MAKRFNITGTCIPERHYMGDMSQKLDKIGEMISDGEYFTINRPRQYGKTTVIYLLEQRLRKDEDYLAIDVSFEGIDSPTYEKHERFIRTILNILSRRFEFLQEKDLVEAVQIALMENNTNFETLVKNLENNPDLYEFVFKIIMNEMDFSYNPRNTIINLGAIYGILKKEKGKVRIHNRLYEQLIYDYMSSNMETSGGIGFYPVSSSYIKEDGSLNVEKVIKMSPRVIF